MKSLADLLKLRPIPGIKEAQTRGLCAEILTRVSGVTILPKQIKISDGCISLSVAPIIKSSLIIKFEEAKEMLAQNGILIREIR